VRRLSQLLLAVIITSAVLLANIPVQAQDLVPRFEPSLCPTEVVPEISPQVDDPPLVECGFLIVPESYEENAGAVIRLPVVIFRSQNQDPAQDPLLFIRGGPGATYKSALSILSEWQILENRDIIILEQRGSLLAKPNLDCDLSLLVDDALPCREDLEDRGLELNYYNTETLVDDLESLRLSLGYDQWNLFGESFSTRLMLLVMKRYPAGVRSVILDSVHPPDVNVYESAQENFIHALQAFFYECKSNPDCNSAYPNLEENFDTLVERLNADPVTLSLVDHQSGQAANVTVDGAWLLAQTYDALYGHLSGDSSLTYWPILIEQLSSGNIELLEPWVIEGVIDWESTLAFGMYFSVMCQDEYAAANADLLEERETLYPELIQWARNALGRSVCEAWELDVDPPRDNQPVKSAIPTLVLSGSHSPVTNPNWGLKAAETLSNSYSFEFPGMGQWVTAASPCAREIVVRFLDDPLSQPESICLTKPTGLKIILPEHISIESGIYRFFVEIHSENADLFRQVALGFSQVLFVGQLIFLAFAIRRPMVSDRWALAAQLLAGLIALLNLSFTITLFYVINDLEKIQSLVLRFGLPDQYAPLLYIPILTNILAAAVMVIAFMIWINGAWTKYLRLFYTLVALAALTFSTLMAYWGFLLLP